MASTGANVDINYSLIQGFACGLQCNNASVHIDSSIFREFPLREQGRSGDPINKLEYTDSDHDAMYIVGGNVSKVSLLLDLPWMTVSTVVPGQEDT